MSHLAIHPIESYPTHRLARYEITETAMTAAAQRSVKAEDPRLELKRHLCAFYCFDPRIKPEDILDFKLISSDDSDRITVHLFLKPNAS